MPSSTPKMARFMAMCAHGGGKNCPPAKVAKEFNQADKGGPLLKVKRRPRVRRKK